MLAPLFGRRRESVVIDPLLLCSQKKSQTPKELPRSRAAFGWNVDTWKEWIALMRKLRRGDFELEG